MTGNERYAEINDGKENFNDIYNQPEPAPYYETLGRLGYCIPGEAKPVLQRVIDARRQAQDDERVTMLDIGCSYGINAALLKYDLELDQLYDWYEDRPAGDPARAVASDRRFFAKHTKQQDLAVVGIDPAERAVGYAVETGLLDAGVVADLESAPIPARDLPAFRGIDLIASTGAIGYVTEKTFQQVLPAVDAARAPWVASFVLRMFPYDQIARTFADFGLTTEKLADVHFAQRRFADAGEEAHVRDQLKALDIDPEPELSQGRYVAEFYLSRPFHDAQQRPLSRLLGRRSAGGDAARPTAV